MASRSTGPRSAVLLSALAGLAGGLVLAVVVTAATDARLAPSIVGGVLLGLVAGLGSSVLYRRRDDEQA